MKFIQTGTFQENSLAKMVMIKPQDSVREILLERLDYLIGFLGKEQPEAVKPFLKRLTRTCQGLLAGDPLGGMPPEIKGSFTEYEHLKTHIGLSGAALSYFAQLLNVEDWTLDETEVTMESLVKAWVFPPYYWLQTLTETTGRIAAVNLYKQYITNFYNDHPSPDRNKFVSLEKWLEDRLAGDTTSSEWVIVHTMLAPGKYAFKNKNCPTCVDAMADLPDVEFKYLVACYGDYAKYRAKLGDDIILTMEHTLMQDDPYCSRVLHDTRINDDLRHPPQEFWDNFEPGNEEEAAKYYSID